MEVNDEAAVQDLPVALPELVERVLPPTPAESIRSHRPSPAPTSTGLPIARGGQSTPKTPSIATMQMPPKEPTMYETQTIYRTSYDQIPRKQGTSNDLLDTGTTYKTAYQDQPKLAPVPALSRPLSAHHDTLRLHEEGVGQDDTIEDEGLQPWDRVMQRLFSWAVVWEEGMFTRAMEDISLNKQVRYPLYCVH